MFILAEISDKMLSIPEMWFFAGLFSLPLVAAAVTHRWAAIPALVLAVAISVFYAEGAYHEAYMEGSFSECVWNELGGVWVAHSLASSMTPAAFVIIIALVKWRDVFTQRNH